MILASMISFLFGAALGQRFNVLVLLPAMPIVTTLLVSAAAEQSQTAWVIVELATAAAICLQFGYFAGIFLRRLILKEPSQRSAPVAGAEASTHHTAQ
jgi:hypothetical protein